MYLKRSERGRGDEKIMSKIPRLLKKDNKPKKKKKKKNKQSVSGVSFKGDLSLKR